MKRPVAIVFFCLVFSAGLLKLNQKANLNPVLVPGQPIDSLNSVVVYYNGGIQHVDGRNTSKEGYNIGLRWQCVEFVKRYYYEYYHHKMPNSYGHAKDFYHKGTADGRLNPDRDLVQFDNPSQYKPESGQIIIFGPTIFNSFGHVAIISKVEKDEIEIIQQNPGPYAK